MESKRHQRFAFGPLDSRGQKASLNPKETMVVFVVVVGLPSSCVLVACWSARVPTQTGIRVHRGVLPVAVAADDDQIFLASYKLSEFTPFIGEASVGMVVVFISTVGSNDWRRTKQHAEGGVRRGYRLFEPAFLFRPPDCLVRPIGRIVSARSFGRSTRCIAAS